MALPTWVTDEKNLGAFKSLSEKLETYYTIQDINTKMARFDAAFVEKLAQLVKSNGAARYLPDEVKEAMRLVCDLAPYADKLPEDKRLDFLKLVASVVGTVCSVFGVE